MNPSEAKIAFRMDFELVLAIAVSVTGFIWLVDMFWRWFKKRFLAVRPGGVERPAHRWIIEYARAFFPVLLIVFLLRSVAVEPFRIPSGSMLPTLQVGDFILVNKYQYGIRLPVVNKKLIEVGSPDYGDVMVFRFPHDENVNFIKRVVGLPGDSVEYRDKTISINGQEIAQDVVGEYWINPESNRKIQTQLFSESFGSEEQHKILIDEKRGLEPLCSMCQKTPFSFWAIIVTTAMTVDSGGSFLKRILSAEHSLSGSVGIRLVVMG